MKTLKAIVLSLLATTFIPLGMYAQETKVPAKLETKTTSAAPMKHHKKHMRSKKTTAEVKRGENKVPSVGK